MDHESPEDIQVHLLEELQMEDPAMLHPSPASFLPHIVLLRRPRRYSHQNFWCLKRSHDLYQSLLILIFFRV